jgi:hypothetical protein
MERAPAACHRGKQIHLPPRLCRIWQTVFLTARSPRMQRDTMNFFYGDFKDAHHCGYSLRKAVPGNTGITTSRMRQRTCMECWRVATPHQPRSARGQLPVANRRAEPASSAMTRTPF